MSDLIRLNASELVALLAKREISSVEVTQAHLDQISKVGDAVHSFLHISGESALATAKDVDSRRAAGEKLADLAGVPIAVKDNLTTTDAPTTAGSKILEGWLPPYDATVVTKLRNQLLPILGKTNLDEFAMGSSTEFSAYGPSKNPWDLTRIPGGSGGGSSSAVSSFQAPLAIGSDTGGSIRFPGAVTGTVGIKPTYGAVSRYGLIALASSLDQIGPVARNVLDAAYLQDAIAGHDPHDSTSLSGSLGSMVEAAKRGSLKGKKVGLIKQLSGDGFQQGVRNRFAEALKLITHAGAEIVEVDCPSFEYAIDAYYLILPAEASSNLAKFDSVRFGMRVSPEGNPTIERVMAATREAGFGPEVKRRIILGTFALSSGSFDKFYGAAQKVRTLIQRDFDAAFAKADVLVSPTAPTTAFKFGEKVSDPLAMYLNDIATIPANLAGIPGISVPIGLADEDNLPVGIQFLAPAHEDARLYEVGAALEGILEGIWGKRMMDFAPELKVN
ncbi:MAG: Asp-tRNA(Asn)/Glu-tRNA(Gln) amidotransferase subunit GatA [Rhodoluna sp.]|nr:Asp-tRNA(Asn)/Glu-tRNA(Gln) amidotransferase subunit GatA [Rhodoluna sp.]